MAYYRLYLMTPDRHIRSVDDFEAGDDAEALEIARNFHQNEDVELWCAKRMVASLYKDGPIILSPASTSPASSGDPHTA